MKYAAILLLSGSLFAGDRLVLSSKAETNSSITATRGSMTEPVETITIRFFQKTGVDAKIRQRDEILDRIKADLELLTKINLEIQQSYKIIVQ